MFDYFYCNGTIYHHVKAGIYVHSDGTDNFQIRGAAQSGDPFDVNSAAMYNSLSIEYALP